MKLILSGSHDTWTNTILLITLDNLYSTKRNINEKLINNQCIRTLPVDINTYI